MLNKVNDNNNSQHECIIITDSPVPISIIANQFVGKAQVRNADNRLYVSHDDLGLVMQVLDSWKCKYSIENTISLEQILDNLEKKKSANFTDAEMEAINKFLRELLEYRNVGTIEQFCACKEIYKVFEQK